MQTRLQRLNQGSVFGVFQGVHDPLPELGLNYNPSNLSLVVNSELDAFGDFLGCHIGSFELRATI
jgi:hypothetical protein